MQMLHLEQEEYSKYKSHFIVSRYKYEYKYKDGVGSRYYMTNERRTILSESYRMKPYSYLISPEWKEKFDKEIEEGIISKKIRKEKNLIERKTNVEN